MVTSYGGISLSKRYKEGSDRYRWERIIYGREEAERRKRVRRRWKYKYWEKMWEKVTRKRLKPEEILWLVYEAIEQHRGWHYASQAHYAEEALELFLEDKLKENEGGEKR